MRTGGTRQGKFHVKRPSRRVRGTVRRDEDARWTTAPATDGHSRALTRGLERVSGKPPTRIPWENLGSYPEGDPLGRGLYVRDGQVHFAGGTHPGADYMRGADRFSSGGGPTENENPRDPEAGQAGLVPPAAWDPLRFLYMGAADRPPARPNHWRGTVFPMGEGRVFRPSADILLTWPLTSRKLRNNINALGVLVH